MGNREFRAVTVPARLAALFEFTAFRQSLTAYDKQKVELAIEERVAELAKFVEGPKNFGIWGYNLAAHADSFHGRNAQTSGNFSCLVKHTAATGRQP
jgi:hypothetical protein